MTTAAAESSIPFEILEGKFGAGASVRYCCPFCKSVERRPLTVAGWEELCDRCGKRHIVPGAEVKRERVAMRAAGMVPQRLTPPSWKVKVPALLRRNPKPVTPTRLLKWCVAGIGGLTLTLYVVALCYLVHVRYSKTYRFATLDYRQAVSAEGAWWLYLAFSLTGVWFFLLIGYAIVSAIERAKSSAPPTPAATSDD